MNSWCLLFVGGTGDDGRNHSIAAPLFGVLSNVDGLGGESLGLLLELGDSTHFEFNLTRTFFINTHKDTNKMCLK